MNLYVRWGIDNLCDYCILKSVTDKKLSCWKISKDAACKKEAFLCRTASRLILHEEIKYMICQIHNRLFILRKKIKNYYVLNPQKSGSATFKSSRYLCFLLRVWLQFLFPLWWKENKKISSLFQESQSSFWSSLLWETAMLYFRSCSFTTDVLPPTSGTEQHRPVVQSFRPRVSLLSIVGTVLWAFLFFKLH